MAGNPAHRHTDGVLCTKVSRYTERTYHPERILTPLRRTGPKGSGRFEAIGWDEALTEIAQRLQGIAARDPQAILPALRRHLDSHGFAQVRIDDGGGLGFPATRLDPDAPWARFAIASITETAGGAPHVLPNLAGSLPNDVFAEILGLPTVWVPHSYRACSQHAPDEHALTALCRDGLRVMAGLWWDLGDRPQGAKGET